jgi:flagellar biosynthesis anti-sigma factor FlgM
MPIDRINHNARPRPILFAAKGYDGSSGKVKPVFSSQRADARISERNEEILRIRQLVDALPDVRLDRINKLAKAIDSGTYDVKSEQIAEAIIQKNLIDPKA